LNGTYDGDAVPLASGGPPVPPPVRFAPFGYIISKSSVSNHQCDLGDEMGRGRKRTPMVRELSAKAQVEDVQRHFPAIGSQKGVEQLVGTV
jgi:hypothetical protein